jgi:hypothetical protein
MKIRKTKIKNSPSLVLGDKPKDIILIFEANVIGFTIINKKKILIS